MPVPRLCSFKYRELDLLSREEFWWLAQLGDPKVVSLAGNSKEENALCLVKRCG